MQLRHRAQSASSSAFLDQALHPEASWPFNLLSDFFDSIKEFLEVGRGPRRTEHGGQLAAPRNSDPLALGRTLDDLCLASNSPMVRTTNLLKHLDDSPR
jgi:hypothetical protein